MSFRQRILEHRVNDSLEKLFSAFLSFCLEYHIPYAETISKQNHSIVAVTFDETYGLDIYETIKERLPLDKQFYYIDRKTESYTIRGYDVAVRALEELATVISPLTILDKIHIFNLSLVRTTGILYLGYTRIVKLGSTYSAVYQNKLYRLFSIYNRDVTMLSRIRKFILTDYPRLFEQYFSLLPKFIVDNYEVEQS
jgi:hypothetical protein